MAVLCVAVFATVFFWIGRQVSLSSTAPEPGLGFPCGTYWGRTFSQVGSIFLYWNIFGLFYMMIGPVVILFQSGKTDEKRKKISYWSWILAIPICFVLGLTPYVVQGAWVHGWGGGYVTGQCRRQVDALHFFLLRYALDHDNRLPVAKDFSELYPQLEPYIPDDAKRLGWRGKFDVCVIGKAWSRTPKPFVWNTEMSGKEVLRGDSLYGADIEYDGPVVTFGDGAVLVIGAPWVTCPYLSGYQFLTAGELRIVGQEKIEQLRNYRDIVPVMDEHRP